MSEFLHAVLSDFQVSSHWELIAVLLSVAYLVLAMRQNSWCWPAAFFSTMIYVVLFYKSALLMESLLNVYYLAMAVYGWRTWQIRGNYPIEDGLPLTAKKSVKITSWPWRKHLKAVIVLAVISVALGYVMDNYTNADFAYLDATTSVFAVFTTWLVTQKVLENWIYWLVIDGASIYLFLQKSFNLTAGLFMVYCVMVIIGYIKWRQDYQGQLQKSASAH